MVTPRTNRPRGRPKGALCEDDDRYVIALADLHMSQGMKPAKAFLQAMLKLQHHAKKLEFSGIPSKKLGAAQNRLGGQIVSYEIGYSINRDKYIDEKSIQGINRLRKKAQRYSTEADKKYRITMAKIFMYALFAKDVDGCAARILELSMEIGEEQKAAELIWAMRVAARVPDLIPVFFRADP